MTSDASIPDGPGALSPQPVERQDQMGGQFNQPSPASPSQPAAISQPAAFTPELVASAVQDSQRDDAMVLGATMRQASQHNPDKVAEAMPVAERAALPIMPTMRNMAEVQKTEKFTPDYVAGLVRDHPDVGAWLNDPSNNNLNAALAHDDIPFLTRVSDAIKSAPSDTLAGAQMIGHAAIQGQEQTTLAKLRFKELMGEAGPEEIKQADALDQAQAPVKGGLLAQSVLGAAQMTPMVADIESRRVGGALAGGIAGTVVPGIGTMAGAAAGGTATGTYESMQIFAGQAYNDMLKIKGADGQPLDPMVARGAALLTGGINAGIATVPLGEIFGKGVAPFIGKDALQEALKVPGVADQLKVLAAKVTKTGITSGGGMAAMQAVTDAGQEIAKIMSPGKFASKPPGQMASEIGQAGVQGVGMGLVAALPEGIGHVNAMLSKPKAQELQGKIAKSENGAAYIKRVSDAVADPEGKLPARSPDALRAFLAKSMGDEDYFVKPEAVQTFYQSLPAEDRAALDEKMPELADDIAQHVTVGTDMNLARADYHAHMAGLKGANDLEPNLRMEADHYSQADINDMHEMLQSLDPTRDIEGADKQNAAKENFVNQLIQQYGQKAAPSGNIDIADKLGDVVGQAYNAYSARYGHIQGAQDLIDKGFLNLMVQRDLPGLQEATKRDDLDLQIDSLKAAHKEATAKLEKGRKMEEVTDPVTGQVISRVKKGRKPAAPAIPTPVLDWLAKQGGVRAGSDLAQELKARDVTPDKVPKRLAKTLFAPDEGGKTGDMLGGDGGAARKGRGALDNIVASEFAQEFSDHPDLAHPKESDNGYVDPEWLLEQIGNEAAGAGALDKAGLEKQAHEDRLDELSRYIDASGGDLAKDSTAKIKRLLQEHLDMLTKDVAGAGEPDVYNQVYGQAAGGDGTPPERRGALEYFPDGNAVMRLFEKENFSTVVHELGHLNWLVLERIAALPGAGDAAADVAAIRDFVGAKDGAALSEAQHEKIADSFIKYLETGDAPSTALQDAFRRMKVLLLHLYRAIRETLPAINPEVKAVFDRMLATDDQIEEMSAHPEYKLDDAYKEFMPAADFARAQRKRDQMLAMAREKTLAESLRQYRKQYTAEYEKQRAAIHADKTEQVNAEPAYQAIDAIRKAGGLSKKDVIKLKGQEILKYLPKGKDQVLAKSGGATVREIAGLSGFRSPHEMLDMLMNAEGRAARIDRLTDEEMLARHGDMMKDGTLEREAEIRAHNEYRAQLLGMQLKAIADKAKLLAPSREAVKARAAKFIGNMPLRDIRPFIHKQAEVQAARRVGRFLATHDYQKAAEAKAQELFNHHLFKMATEAKADMDKWLEKTRRLINQKDEDITRKRWVTDEEGNKYAVRRDIDYVYAARAILARYGMGHSNFDFAAWQKNMRAENPDLAEQLNQAIRMWDNPPPATQRQIRNGRYAGTTATTPGWRYMTLDEFGGLKAAVTNMLEVGEKQNEFTADRGTDKERPMLMKDVVEQTSDQITKLGPSSIKSGYGGSLKGMDHTKWTLLSAKAQWRRVEHWIGSVDGGATGPFRSFVWNPVKDALGRYRDQEREVMARVKDIIAEHRDGLLGDEILAPELTSENEPDGYRFDNKAHLIGMLAHTGNDSNFYKLLNGYGWEEEAFHDFIKRAQKDGTLTKQDYDLVQSLWDVAESLKPQAQKAMKDMYGYRFDEVTATPVHTPFGSYRGGYWPAIVDRNVSEDAAMRQDRDLISTAGQAMMFPSTGRGFTKSRDNQYAGPLEMKLDLLPSHIDKVLRFIHVEPAVKDVAKLLMNREFRDAAFKVDRTIVTEMLIPWLQRSARQVTELPITDGKAWSVLNKGAHFLRGQIGVLTFIGNIPNMFIHAGSIGVIGHEVGWGRTSAALMQLLKNRSATVDLIHGLSAEMRSRGQVFGVDDAVKINRLLNERNPWSKVNDFSKDNAYVLQKMVWTSLDHVGWLAAFNKAMEGDVKGITEGDKLEAARHADALVRQGQGSHKAEDISRLEFQSHAAKLLQFFYGYFNNAGNVLATEGAKIARGDQGAGAKAGSAAYLFVTHVVIASVLAELIAGGLRGAVPAPQDYKDAPAWRLAMGEYLGSGVVHYMGGMVPGVDAVLDQAISTIGGHQYRDTITLSPALTMMENLTKEVPALYKAMFKHGSKEAAVRDVIGGLGGLAFPALGAVKRPALYIMGLEDHKIHPQDALDVARGVIGGPRPGNMKQR